MKLAGNGFSQNSVKAGKDYYVILCKKLKLLKGEKNE